MSGTYPLVGEERAALGRFNKLVLDTESPLTARAGGGQASATVLTDSISHVVTVATAADSVKLPPAVVGTFRIVINAHAANAIQVFGDGTDTINDVAAATGVSQAALKTAMYICPVAGKWFRILSA